MELAKLKQILEYPVVVADECLHRVYTWNGADTIHVYDDSLEYIREEEIADEYQRRIGPAEARQIIHDIIIKEKREIEREMDDHGVV